MKGPACSDTRDARADHGDGCDRIPTPIVYGYLVGLVWGSAAVFCHLLDASGKGKCCPCFFCVEGGWLSSKGEALFVFLVGRRALS